MSPHPVSIAIDRQVAVLRIDNPPVNSLGNTVRAALHDALGAATANPAVRAIVIAGAGRMFCGGADIRQFGTPAAFERPLSRDIQARIREARRPVVAAIHGMALGGGLELALGCHYRVALAGSRLGLPEVRLGLIPGGGGTQRLPRLIGVEAALDLILNAKTVTAAEALDLGLIDAVCDEDIVQAASDFARARVDSAEPLPDLHRRGVPGGGADGGIDFAAARAALPAQAPDLRALQAAIDCIEFACRATLDDGLTRERAVFEELMNGPESQRLRAAFFAERRAAKTAASRSADG